MSLDPIESSALIPNPTENFDEIYIVVQRKNGRFIERASARLKTRDTCNGGSVVISDEQVFLDSAVTYSVPVTVSSLSQTNPVTLTIPGHGLSDGDFVDLTDNIGYHVLSGNEYVVWGVSGDDINIYGPGG